MATLWISEFQNLTGAMNGGVAQAAKVPTEAEQTVSIAGTSAQSSAFGSKTRLVRIFTDAACSISFGTNPTATAAMLRLAANQTEYYGVNAGDKVAVIT